MALGKKRIVAQRSDLKHRRGVEEGGLGLELELVQYKKVFGRKRILVSDTGDSIFTSPVRKISSKKLCDKAPSASCQSPELEDLHLDILVRIICRVEHEDLKQLFHVSKTVREATLIAKQSHFAYSTPRKTSVFQHRRFSLDKPFGLGDGDDYEIEAPGAPLQKGTVSVTRTILECQWLYSSESNSFGLRLIPIHLVSSRFLIEETKL